MDVKTGCKDFVQPFLVARSEFKRQKALSGGGHAVVKETEHHDHPTYHIVDAIVLHAKCLQDHP